MIPASWTDTQADFLHCCKASGLITFLQHQVCAFVRIMLQFVYRDNLVDFLKLKFYNTSNIERQDREYHHNGRDH
jgi:hypothetical protein